MYSSQQPNFWRKLEGKGREEATKFVSFCLGDGRKNGIDIGMDCHVCPQNFTKKPANKEGQERGGASDMDTIHQKRGNPIVLPVHLSKQRKYLIINALSKPQKKSLIKMFFCCIL